MPKLITQCKSPEEAHKLIDERIEAALMRPSGVDIEKFRQLIAQRGQGKVPPTEEIPEPPEATARKLPIRTKTV